MEHGSTIRGASGRREKSDVRALTYLPLVPVIAEHVYRQVAPPVGLGDLVKDGVAGLIEGARIYTPQSRVRLGTYLKHRIKGAILDGLLSGTASPRQLHSEQRYFLNTRQTRTGARSVETQDAERGDEFLMSLFALQRCSEYSENTAGRVGRLVLRPK
jgi:DNA-directed RNA polymerase specialized sigma subunit